MSSRILKYPGTKITEITSKWLNRFQRNSSPLSIPLGLPHPSFILKRWYQVPVNSLKRGQVVSLKSKLWIIIDFHHHTQARGGGHYKVDFKELKTGMKATERFHPTSVLEGIDLQERKLKYMYADEFELHLLDSETYDEVVVPFHVFQGGKESLKFLMEDSEITLRSVDDEPVLAVPPKEVTLKVVSVQASNRSGGGPDSAKGTGYKLAELENGSTMNVPDFIKVDDSIVVNVAQGTYVNRAK